MSTQSEAGAAGTGLDYGWVGLDALHPLSDGLQTVLDVQGNLSPLQLSTYQVVISAPQGPPPVTLQVAEGNSVRLDMGEGTSLSMGWPGSLSVDAYCVPGGRLIVNDEGNVGINQPSPAYNLDVQGTAQVSGGVTFPGLPSVALAPPTASFAAIVVDTNTGILYLNG